MGMSGGSGRGELNAEINVTPLVDVMLVLLIIFMITAPMLNTGVELELPQADTAPLPDNLEGKLVLRISPEGTYHLGSGETSVLIPHDLLAEKLQTNVLAKTGLYIEAHKALPYEIVLYTMGIARKAGVSKLMLVADPLDATGKPAGIK
jgi:biopolymer transport protein TolR